MTDAIDSLIDWLRERTELTGWVAAAAFAVVVGLVLTPPVLRHLPTRKDRKRAIRAVRRWTVALGSITLVSFIAFAVPVLLGPPSTGGSTQASPTSQGTPTSSPTPDVLPSDTPELRIAALPASDGTCPSPQDARGEERVEIEVYWWCIGPAITGDGQWDDSQFQLKVRLGITANPRGSTDVDISTAMPSTIRVLIPYTEDHGWSPPPKTAAGGDKPECVYIDGAAYWAIPPNANDDAQIGPDGSYNFASHWNPADWGHPDGLLTPGEFIGDRSRAEVPSSPDQRGRTSSDLIFTLPAMAYAGLYGVALFDTGSSADASQWVLLAACEQVRGCMNEQNRQDPSTF